MRNLLATIERQLLLFGVLLLVIFASALIHREVSSKQALLQFEKAKRAAPIPQEAPSGEPVDFTLWSEKRVRAYEESLEVYNDLPLATVSLGRLKVLAPVFKGTGDLVLNRGVGWIAGTAKPGETGNVAIAGHRDGFFRGLKDVTLGDKIELSTLSSTAIYTVDRIQIVDPENVGVLRNRDVPSLTLVTCYPFYFIGDAPQRFIVQAVLDQYAPGTHLRRGSVQRD
jgi:sortase A